jgi:uridylate kinase
MKTMVLSLGGSLIIPNKPNFKFLDQFKKTLQSNFKKYKFVIVTGGGTLARKYITVLKKQHKSKKELSIAGIMATRTNARFIMQLFGNKLANDSLPKSMKQVKFALRKNKVVICGALRYTKDSTSDSTAATLANYLNADFINLTNVPGLYTSNPKKNKNAKFIPKISHKAFNKLATKSKFKAGQHFVLDQNASRIIKKHKITTYILGENLKNLNNLLKGKKFIGTMIEE